jgi:SAM-dependent methyltransferase
MAYRFDHEWQRERERLATIEQAYDPWSIRTIEATSPQPGWRCLEVGAGGGSIAEWLCRRVGKAGRVTATDLETKFLASIEAENLEVRTHDIVSDPLEEGCYDLVHARAVLEHLPERDDVLRRLIGAVKPGGWLTVDCGDFSSVRQVGGRLEDREFFEEAFEAVTGTSRGFGADLLYGGRIGDAFRAGGLEQVEVEGFITEWGLAHPIGSLYELTFQRLQQPAIETGAITSADFDRLLEVMRSPDFRALSHIFYSARGRRPPSDQSRSLAREALLQPA